MAKKQHKKVFEHLEHHQNGGGKSFKSSDGGNIMNQIRSQTFFASSQPSLFSAVGLKSMIDSTANFFLPSLSPRLADLEMDSLTINGFFFPASESTICKICSVQYGGEIPNKLIWQFREI